jgi:hypothetical protein
MHAKHFSPVKRWIVTSLLSFLTIAFVWQGMFLVNNTAMADSTIVAELGDRVENKADRDLSRTKGFIEDTKDKVKQTANKNASKVDRATDNDSLLENKAKKDASRIENKADKDAARTKKAVDKTQNIVESTIDNIKDAFNN